LPVEVQQIHGHNKQAFNKVTHIPKDWITTYIFYGSALHLSGYAWLKVQIFEMVINGKNL
jgi:hypothetical protein